MKIMKYGKKLIKINTNKDTFLRCDILYRSYFEGDSDGIISRLV